MSFTKTICIACATLLPTTALADWNGWYAGVSVGPVSGSEFEITSGIGASAGLEDTTSIGGFWGAATQTNNTVFGFEIELSNMPGMFGTFNGFYVEHSGITIDLKVRLGYTFDDFLPYAVVGVSRYNFENDLITSAFLQSGVSFGVGVDYMVTDKLFVGAEYLARRSSGEVEIIGTRSMITHESSIESLSVRTGFKF